MFGVCQAVDSRLVFDGAVAEDPHTCAELGEDGGEFIGQACAHGTGQTTEDLPHVRVAARLGTIQIAGG